MKSRRDFVKLLGGGAIASLFVGRVVANNAVANNAVKRPQITSAKTGLEAIHLSQTSSYPAYKNRAKAGHWWVREEYEFIDLGPTLHCTRIDYVGMKTVFYPDRLSEDRSCQVFTDPNSMDFQQIVRMADRVSNRAFYGPVYILTGEDFQYELFCSTKSMRRFAVQEIGSSGKTNVILTSKLVSTRDYSWFVPSLCGTE